MSLTAIILAAGRGKRMMPLTKDRPKAVLEVGGRPIVSYMVDFARAVGAERTIVVGRYGFEKLRTAIGGNEADVKLIYNPDEANQNLADFTKALEEVSDNSDILVANADYIFKEHTAKKVAEQLSGFSIYCSFDTAQTDDDVMKVKADGEGRLVSISKKIDDFDAIYTGLWSFGGTERKVVEKDASRLFDTGNRKELSLEDLFRELARGGHSVFLRDVGKADWFEFDTPEDLKIARKELGP